MKTEHCSKELKGELMKKWEGLEREAEAFCQYEMNTCIDTFEDMGEMVELLCNIKILSS